MLAHNLSNLLFTILQPPLQNRPKRECLIPVDMKKIKRLVNNHFLTFPRRGMDWLVIFHYLMLRTVLHLWSIPYYTWGRYYICGQSLITLEVVITFVVNPLLHLRAVLHLWSIPYYTWGRYYICGQSLITLEVVITFVVNHLLHLRALLHLWSIITFVASTYINCG